MQLHEGFPEGMRFIGARKLKGSDVMLLLSSMEARNWLNGTEITKAFLAGFNSMSKIWTPILTVIAEYVPVSFQPAERGAICSVKQEGGLERGSIKNATWI
ncbi:hypothetical protein BDN71DRAFT_1395022 [Pleurotus eryngii]|uniref:Uncharacterized protein n=1 Tax=Pleurotus eryngii TaxID=5323 RepID=A0A9P6DFA2_PLEER|nr:hypothetical protein BDN71DRAFT_1395022 [Pleurotus eryngii]